MVIMAKIKYKNLNINVFIKFLIMANAPITCIMSEYLIWSSAPFCMKEMRIDFIAYLLVTSNAWVKGNTPGSAKRYHNRELWSNELFNESSTFEFSKFRNYTCITQIASAQFAEISRSASSQKHEYHHAIAILARPV